jgi:signal transduction histidine kinase
VRSAAEQNEGSRETRRMTTAEVVDRLSEHRTVGGAPRPELEWLAAHGSMRHLVAGDVLTTKGKTVEGLFVVMSGRISLSMDRGTGTHKTLEWRQGDVTGFLPYSRLVGPPGDTVAEEPTDIFAVPRDLVSLMIRECETLTSILVHTMIDRARTFTSAGLHDEKIMSLGKLSAGLAHELNNPASAIERSAALLERRIDDSERSAQALGAARLNDAQLAALDTVRVSCLATRERGVSSPVAQAEREEAIAAWLEDHGLDPATVDALSETAVTFDALDRLVAAIDGQALDNALRWVAAACSVRKLASEIQEAATRISVLVGAIKGFTHMDQAAVAEPVDVTRGIDDTVIVLRSKARSRSATVAVEVEPGLPKVLGFAGELNQIWSNLIDNALDAIPDAGRVDVRAALERQHVVVCVIDNGSGIPEQIRGQIFDPFFTTKPVGKGTGLGLDIVRRLVRHNDGDISVESQPGRTEFRVALPAVTTAASGVTS